MGQRRDPLSAPALTAVTYDIRSTPYSVYLGSLPAGLYSVLRTLYIHTQLASPLPPACAGQDVACCRPTSHVWMGACLRMRACVRVPGCCTRTGLTPALDTFRPASPPHMPRSPRPRLAIGTCGERRVLEHGGPRQRTQRERERAEVGAGRLAYGEYLRLCTSSIGPSAKYILCSASTATRRISRLGCVAYYGPPRA